MSPQCNEYSHITYIQNMISFKNRNIFFSRKMSYILFSWLFLLWMTLLQMIRKSTGVLSIWFAYQQSIVVGTDHCWPHSLYIQIKQIILLHFLFFFSNLYFLFVSCSLAHSFNLFASNWSCFSEATRFELVSQFFCDFIANLAN